MHGPWQPLCRVAVGGRFRGDTEMRDGYMSTQHAARLRRQGPQRRLAFGVAAVLTSLIASVAAQAVRPVQQLFEAGQDAEALEVVAAGRAEGSAQLENDFLAGQIRMRMNQPDAAGAEFERLSAAVEPVWRLVGESAAALVGADLARALDAANRATGVGPDHFYAQYQLGLVSAKMENWAAAAAAFDRAAELDPTFAYAHYYAGLANSRIKRADRTAEHLERFLKLAPMAPERPAMESLMRTLRGR